jgi:beta-lactam-binding protein with PASTA domain
MSSPFAITTTVNKVRSEKTKKANVPFTVTNQWEGEQRGRARIVSEAPALAEWFILEGEAERTFETKGSVQQYVVQVAPDGRAPSGDYSFRLDMVWVENPEKNYVQGPGVAVEIPEQVKPKIPNWVFLAIGAAVLLIAVAAAVLLMNRGVTVPDVAGLSVEQAIIRLQDDDLRFGESQQIDSCVSVLGPIEARTVVSSDPEAGETVKRRDVVHLIYSSGREPMGEFEGQPVSDVRFLLEGAGFQVREETSDSSQPEGTVIGSLPEAGVLVPCGQEVVLQISTGTMAIPVVRGEPAVGALQMITSAGFGLWATAYEADRDIPAEHATRTNPTDRAAASQVITLYISSGPPKVAVPSVEGLTAEQALEILVEEGFNMVGTEVRGHPTVPEDLVIDTEPPAGSEVSLGGGLLLLVSAGPSFGTTPNFYTLTLNIEPGGIAGLSDQAGVLSVPANTRQTVEVKNFHNGCRCRFFVCSGTSYGFAGWTINGVPSPESSTSISLVMNDDKVLVARYSSVRCQNIFDDQFNNPWQEELPKFNPELIQPVQP